MARLAAWLPGLLGLLYPLDRGDGRVQGVPAGLQGWLRCSAWPRCAQSNEADSLVRARQPHRPFPPTAAPACSDYNIALRLELRRREIKDDPARVAELAAYFTHCNLQVGGRVGGRGHSAAAALAPSNRGAVLLVDLLCPRHSHGAALPLALLLACTLHPSSPRFSHDAEPHPVAVSPALPLPLPLAARAPGAVAPLGHVHLLQDKELQHLRHLLPTPAGAAARREGGALGVAAVAGGQGCAGCCADSAACMLRPSVIGELAAIAASLIGLCARCAVMCNVSRRSVPCSPHRRWRRRRGRCWRRARRAPPTRCSSTTTRATPLTSAPSPSHPSTVATRCCRAACVDVDRVGLRRLQTA